MVFFRSKKQRKQSLDKSSTGQKLGRLSSNASTVTDVSSEASDEQRERDLFVYSDTQTGDLSVRASPLFKGSAKLDSPVSVEQLWGKTKAIGSSEEFDEEGVDNDTDRSDDDPVQEEDEVQFGDKDAYGQRHPVENPALIAKRLVAFDTAVSKLPKKKRATLNQAIERCPELLDEAFKLKFLRCECFNVKVSFSLLI